MKRCEYGPRTLNLALPEQVRRKEEEEKKSCRQDIVGVLKKKFDETVRVLLRVGEVGIVLKKMSMNF
jgi:hypothetical protein